MASPDAHRTVFLDRDGTINDDLHHVSRVEDFHLLPGAGQAVARLNRAGWRVVVVTNQSAIARGMLTEATLGQIHAKMEGDLAAFGAHIDGLFYCPHHPDDGCGCRKPKPGLVEQAAGQMGLDLSRCWLVGDKPTDIELGRATGCRTVLVLTNGRGEPAPGASPDAVATDLSEAVELILSQEE